MTQDNKKDTGDTRQRDQGTCSNKHVYISILFTNISYKWLQLIEIVLFRSKLNLTIALGSCLLSYELTIVWEKIFES